MAIASFLDEDAVSFIDCRRFQQWGWSVRVRGLVIKAASLSNQYKGTL